MAKEENLIPQSKRTKAEQREIAKQGGIASGEARRKKRTMRETAEILLQTVKEGEGEKITHLEAVVAALVLKAEQGDVSAINSLRDLIGEKPKDSVAVEGKMAFNSGGLKETLEELRKKE